MSLHPNVRRCTHIQVTGHRCGSPALKQEYFCYFHTRMIKGVQTRVDSQTHPVALIESAEAIQSALMHMIDSVLKGAIDNKRAALVLKALYIAVRNSRNVYFSIRQDDMVREVPNYAQQYLTEHPQPDSDGHSDTVAPCPERHPRKKCHPERSKIVRAASDLAESKLRRERASEPAAEIPSEVGGAEDPDNTNTSNQASGNSPHPSERKRDAAGADDTPPLTTRQSQRWNEIKQLEASVQNAMRGDWRALRTVFHAVGLTPGKFEAPCGRERSGSPQPKS